jgi:SAM-dependent methyltransferase
VSELLIGCGNSRAKKLSLDSFEWSDLTTIDHDPNCGADVVHDLEQTPWPLDDNSFDECHAYCVLEHLGRQGDYESFFRHFYEIWRILKPDGKLFGFCPSYRSMWAWADPSHTRIIAPGTMLFLSQKQYEERLGKTAMTDFRWLWKGDLEPVHLDDDGERFSFVLRAIKG